MTAASGEMVQDRDEHASLEKRREPDNILQICVWTVHTAPTAKGARPEKRSQQTV